MATPECFGCGELVPGGMEILGQYLCPVCEAKLVGVKTENQDYQNWVDNCKRFWKKTGIKFKDAKD